MKLNTKRLILNRYTKLTAAIYFALGIVSWLLNTDIIKILLMNPNSKNLKPGTKEWLIYGTFRLDLFMDGFFYLVTVFLPFAAAFLISGFLDEQRGFLTFAYLRYGTYKKIMRKKILQYTLCSSAVLSVCYLIVVLIGLCFNRPEVGDSAHYSTAFSLLLGTDRLPEKLIIRYFLDVFFKGLLAPFSFSLLAIAVSFLTSKKYICIITPFLYTYISIFASSYLGIKSLYIGYSLYYTNGSIWNPITPLLIMTAVSVLIIECGLRRRERFGV